ncbi:MAG: UbiA family prenyltransferase [Geminicoccaceae bacterium]
MTISVREPDQAAAQTEENPETADRLLPLVVDLEEVLLTTDLLTEALFSLTKHKPLYLFCAPFWLAKGRTYFAHRLLVKGMPDVRLPYDRSLLAHLEQESRRGRPLVLVSSGNRDDALSVVRDLGLFEQIVTYTGSTSSSGNPVRDRLRAEFGAQGFELFGTACRAPQAQPGTNLSETAATGINAERVVEGQSDRLSAYLQAMRPRQWLKNALVFVPLLTANRVDEIGLLVLAIIAFLSFSLCASSAYIVNDMLDLEDDRGHPEKKKRPFASGQLTASHALVLIPLLLAAAIAVGMLLPLAFLGVLAAYYLLTLLYCVGLKNLVILDVLTLAGLHALRVVGGCAATGIALSHWLLAFCVFLFFSLALVKRYAELILRREDGSHACVGPYRPDDSMLLAALGVASGFIAVLVLALYISSDHASNLYPREEVLWLLGVLLLYWISYMWLMAHRAKMTSDPLTFLLSDRTSCTLIVAMSIILIGTAMT